MRSNVFVGVKFDGSAGYIQNLRDDNGVNSERISRSVSRSSTTSSGQKSRLSNNYDYILLPITSSRYRETVRREFKIFEQELKSVDHSVLQISEPQLQDLCVPPFNVASFSNGNDSPGYIGLLSSWLDLETNKASIREVSFQVLLNECKYARFVGINKLIVAPPRELSELQRYSQVIARLLNHKVVYEEPPLLLSISLPLYEDSDSLSTWELWNTIRKLCNYHRSLSVSLAIPRIRTPTHVLKRWLCEPVSCLLISSSIFATNQYHYPVLHKFNQNLIQDFQRLNGNPHSNVNGELCIILHGMEKYANSIKGGENSYLEYINYLLKKGDKLFIMKNGDNQEIFRNVNGIDFCSPRLMPPLKPHSEALSNQVYSVFEKDVAKYDSYHIAIEEALQDLLKFRGYDDKNSPLLVLVAGAGRGPLVDRTIQIVKNINIWNRVEVIALEKNAQACLYLQKRNHDFWNNRVRIVKEDMLYWKNNSIKVDLCISELLGSFGCNELAPECLWEIEKNHSKTSTIFIPQSYTSYVAPISSPSLLQNLSQSPKARESPWIMHNVPYCILSSRINEIWSFQHPLKNNYLNADFFSKSSVSEFKIKHRGEMHGIIGFFTSRLYNNTILSTLPDDCVLNTISLREDEIHNSSSLKRRIDQLQITEPLKTHHRTKYSSDSKINKSFHTPGLYSWSPIVFPLKQSFPIADDTELSVFMSRNHSLQEKSIWYEWSVESFVYLVVSGTSIQKPNVISPPLRKNPQKTGNQLHNYSGAGSRAGSGSGSAPGLGLISGPGSGPGSGLGSGPGSGPNSRPTSGPNSVPGSVPPSGPGSGPGSQYNCESRFSELDEVGFNTSAEQGFLPHNASGWQSVNDIHGMSSSIENVVGSPMFNLGNQNEMEEDEDEDEEVHVRVRTGISILHNISGNSFSIPL